MAAVQRAGDGWVAVMRWGGRVLAMLAAALFLLFLWQAGTKVFPSLSWTRPQGWPLALAIVAALGGVLAAWRWELAGGVVALVGALAIVVLVVLGSGLDMLFAAVLFVAPLALAGLLYLGCCARCRVVAHRTGD